MAEYAFPTYELLLDTSEGKEEKIKIVQAGTGEAFNMKCTVTGEHQEEPDLSWLKDGKEIPEIDALNVTDTPGAGKSIVVTGFDATKHSGVYECGVKQKGKKFHRRSLKIEQKPGNAQIADGYAPCLAQDQNRCLNGGICMMHKASGSISCLCPADNIGRKCESVAIAGFEKPQHVLPEYYPAAVATAAAVVMIFFLLTFCYLMRQRRQIKRLKEKINRLRSPSDPEQETISLNNMNDQLKNEVLAKFESIDEQDDQCGCNCCSVRLGQGRSANAVPSPRHRAHLSRDFSQQTESVCSRINKETDETANKSP